MRTARVRLSMTDQCPLLRRSREDRSQHQVEFEPIDIPERGHRRLSFDVVMQREREDQLVTTSSSSANT